MKTIAALTLFLFTSLSFAGTILDCKNIFNDSTYEMRLDNRNWNLRLVPLIKDDSSLALAEADLKYIEGESSPLNTTYGGESLSGIKIALVLNHGTETIIRKKPVVANVYFTEGNPERLDGRITLNCTLR
jgi:hypothetical protein